MSALAVVAIGYSVQTGSFLLWRWCFQSPEERAGLLWFVLWPILPIMFLVLGIADWIHDRYAD